MKKVGPGSIKLESGPVFVRDSEKGFLKQKKKDPKQKKCIK